MKSQDKLKVFRRWLASQKSFEKTENIMVLQREKAEKGKREWECLTIGEMAERNFSLCGAEIPTIDTDAHDA